MPNTKPTSLSEQIAELNDRLSRQAKATVDIARERDQLAARVRSLEAERDELRNEAARHGNGRRVPLGPSAPPPPSGRTAETTKVARTVPQRICDYLRDNPWRGVIAIAAAVDTSVACVRSTITANRKLFTTSHRCINGRRNAFYALAGTPA